MKKRQKERRPSKLDMITVETARGYAHASTADITRQRIVYACEANVLEGEIKALASRIKGAKAELTRVNATLLGLEALVDGRRAIG